MVKGKVMEKRFSLKRPSAKMLAQFRVSQIGNDTVRTYLSKGFSLAICCRNCPRTNEWTPPDLLEKFGDKLGTRIDAIAVRLSCKGEDGCGSKDIAVFPWGYDHPWHWPPQDED